MVVAIFENVPVAVADRITLYSVTATLSVEAVHDKLIFRFPDEEAVRFAGAVGGVVSAGGGGGAAPQVVLPMALHTLSRAPVTHLPLSAGIGSALFINWLLRLRTV